MILQYTNMVVVLFVSYEAGEVYDEKKEQDIREILNYRKALVLAEAQVFDYGISLGLILELHKILMALLKIGRSLETYT